MCVEPFPTDNRGLTSLKPQEKHNYVERFRVLLSSWPGFPSDLGSLMPSATFSRVWTVEKKLANFYTQSFFDNFSRPPVVPHYLPIRGVLNSLFVCLWIHAFFFARCEDFFFSCLPYIPPCIIPHDQLSFCIFLLSVANVRPPVTGPSSFYIYLGDLVSCVSGRDLVS